MIENKNRNYGILVTLLWNFFFRENRNYEIFTCLYYNFLWHDFI